MIVEIVMWVTTIVTGASLIAAETPTPKADAWLGKLQKFVALCALNIGKAKQKEERTDHRKRSQAKQQSDLNDQRNSAQSPKNFESAGNDTIGGGFDLGGFDPR